MSDSLQNLPAAERLSAAIDRVVGFVCAILFGLMTVDVIVGVLFRYVLNMPLGWVEESSRYLMIWGASLSVSSGIRLGEHVGLTVLIDSLKVGPMKKALALAINLLILGFLGVLLVYGIISLKDSALQIAPTLGVSMFVPRLAIPVSMAVAIIQTLLMGYLNLTRGPETNKNPVIIDI